MFGICGPVYGFEVGSDLTLKWLAALVLILIHTMLCHLCRVCQGFLAPFSMQVGGALATLDQ